MEADLKTSDRDTSQLSDPPSDLDSSSDGASPAQQTEWLATTRTRRSTAGNRMKSMLASQDPDSDLELLFAEDENDQGFSDAGSDGSDVQMESSSDDDADADADADDLDGEKELERQAREQRAARRKRSAREAIPARFRKRPAQAGPATAATAAPEAAPAPAPRPKKKKKKKKKSERTSWLPSPADLPTRASARKTTRISKEQLHQQMAEREARRLRQLAQMAKKAARLEATRKPPMTQEQRLAEAAVVETRNSRSLNRWEEAEKQREEERRARLAALSRRTLRGPVITFWSGRGRWADADLRALRPFATEVEERPRKKRDKAADRGAAKGAKQAKLVSGAGGNQAKDDDAAAAAGRGGAGCTEENPSLLVPAQGSVPLGATASTGPSSRSRESSDGDGGAARERKAVEAAKARPAPERDADADSDSDPDPDPDSWTATSPPPPPPPREPAARVLAPPRGIATNAASSSSWPPAPTPMSSILAPPPISISISTTISLADATPSQPSASPPPAAPTPVDLDRNPASTHQQHQQPVAAEPTSPPRPSQAGTHAPEPDAQATRNAVILHNFNDAALRDKTVQTQILFGRKMAKLPKPAPAPVCVITNHPARYRDPRTGLPFYNMHAYKELQRLRRGEYSWSGLLGAWVGDTTQAARGVPERFAASHPRG